MTIMNISADSIEKSIRTAAQSALSSPDAHYQPILQKLTAKCQAISHFYFASDSGTHLPRWWSNLASLDQKKFLQLPRILQERIHGVDDLEFRVFMMKVELYDGAEDYIRVKS